MIHVFNCCKEACALPGKVCAQCGTCFKDCNCQEICEPCVFACEQCNASLNEFLNKPLGGFVFMAFWLGGLEAASAGYALYKVDALSKCSFRDETLKSIGLLNWLYVQAGMACVHLVFAPYVQCRLWAKLKESNSEENPATGQHVVATKAIIKESFAHVFLHDIGVCLYVFLLVFSFWWSQRGLELTSTACSFGDFWFTPWRAASLGICMFWFVPIYAMGWWCYISCMAAKDGMTISGYNQAIYHRPDQAEKLRDDASQPPKQESMLDRAKRAAVRASGSETQAEPTGPKKGLSKACSPSQMAKLLACIGLDVMGNATYLLPGLGEGVDVAYAPAQAVALKMMFDANGIALIGFAEELLPFTDVLPTATIAWVIETFFPDSILGRLLGIQQT